MFFYDRESSDQVTGRDDSNHDTPFGGTPSGDTPSGAIPSDDKALNAESASQGTSKGADELAACRHDAAQWKEQCLRSRADFENFSRRVAKERATLTVVAQNDLLLDLLAIVDDFERALEQEQKGEASAALAGFSLIKASLDKVLESYGVKPMEECVTFDPTLHDAISRLAMEGKAAGEIVHIAQKGYMRNGVLLRPAKVVVAQ